MILVIICQILAELWSFFDLVFVGGLILVSDCRDALILLKVCRRIYHCKIQVSSILVIIHKIMVELWSFLDLVFVSVLILVSAQ